jgi:hypothetical protein
VILSGSFLRALLTIYTVLIPNIRRGNNSRGLDMTRFMPEMLLALVNLQSPSGKQAALTFHIHESLELKIRH